MKLSKTHSSLPVTLARITYQGVREKTLTWGSWSVAAGGRPANGVSSGRRADLSRVGTS